MKKVLALLLCLTLLLPMLPTVGVYAAETVIFADDFESYEVGITPEKATNVPDKWSETAVSATSTVTVYEDDAGEHMLRVMNTAATTGGPRIGKKLYLKGVQDLTVAFRTKSEGNASVGFSLVNDSKTEAASIKGATPTWTDYEMVIDIAKGTYVIYQNGKKSSTGSLAASITAGVTLRFGGSVREGGCVYYDNIKISTTSSVDVANLSNPTNVEDATVQGGGDAAASAPTTSDADGYKAAAAVEKIAAASDTTIFADDFESHTVGAAMSYTANAAQQWTERAVSNTSTVTTEEVDGSKVLRLTNSADSNGGPRLGKKIYPVGIKTLAVSFMVRAEGSATVGFSAYNGATAAFNLGGQIKSWTAYEFICDLENKTYTRYKNGVKETSGALAAEIDSEITFRFGGSVSKNGSIFYDNIRISTPEKVDVNQVETGAGGQVLTIAQYAEQAAKTYKGEAAPSVTLPAGAIQLFAYDNNAGGEKINTGTSATWTKVQTTDTLKATAVSKNELILAVNPKVTKTRSALLKNLSLGENAKDLTIEYNLYFIGAGSAGFSLAPSGGSNVFAGTQEITSTNAAVKSGWNTFRYEIDFAAGKYNFYLNGKAMESNAAFSAKASSYAEMVATLQLSTDTLDSIVLLDNLLMYTNTPVSYSTMLYGTEGVNWDLVKGEPITQASFVSNLRAHPRVLLTSWDEMAYKIQNDKKCAEWYANVKSAADQLLSAPNIPYTFDNGRNWLTGARSVRNRLAMLGFVYGITNDRKYIDRALEEMRFAATHPDWSNVAPIISAECMMGYALAYDWMYYGLTDAEKVEIRQIICDKALWQFIHSYAGNNNAEIARGVSNRTTVANSCALMTAIALADEMPDVANYVYKNALKYTKPPFEEYNDDGGFPEGTMYWEYSTRFAVLLLSALQAAPVDGYTHDADAQWFFDRPSMKNTAKYNIYLNSTKKKFNFGDANDGLVFSPTLYWFADYCDEPFYKWYEDDMLDKHQSTYQGVDAVQAIIWYNINMKADAGEIAPDVVFNTPNAAVSTMRSSFADDRALFAALQGGDNTTGHMFYSLGNFAIDAFGQRFINTIGASNYSAQFDGELYYVKRTEGQNTILFNPDASAGQEKKAQAVFTDFKSDEDEAFAILDMTQTHKDIAEAKRGMYMTRGRKSVIIQDEFKMKKPSEVYWFAQTTAAITMAEDKMSALLRLGGEQMLVVLKQAPAGVTLSVMEAKPLPTSPTAADEILKTYYKLAVHAENVTEGTISVEFIPIAQGETPSIARQTAFAPMAQWALDSTVPAQGAADAFANSVALKIGSPVAFAAGHKTYVDPDNAAVMPFTESGRTLVPVRFISEKIGGVVSWDEATQKVTIQRGSDEIILYIGLTEMLVNGERYVLDVPAKTVNGRTVIPLRAMVEAIGKKVFWDDRGLILINDAAQTPSEDEIVKMLTLLDTRVFVGGAEFTAFTPDTTDYIVKPGDGSVSVVSGGAEIPVHLDGLGAGFTLAGRNYTLRFEADKFANLIGTDSAEVVSTLGLNVRALSTAQSQMANYIKVEGAEMSTGHDKYVSTGTIDNVINKELINRWSGYGSGAYIIYDLGHKQNIHSFGLATLSGDVRTFKFALQISDDGVNWKEVLNTQTSGTTTLFDIYKLGDVQARYVKAIGYGDSNGGLYNSWTEVRFWASAAQEQADKETWKDGLDGGAVYKVGDVLKLDVTATNAKGALLDSSATTFSVDKEGVVSVAPDGSVTVIGEGKVRITAAFNNGFKTLTTFAELVCEK